jgi:phosphatidylglycerophosphate synthase
MASTAALTGADTSTVRVKARDLCWTVYVIDPIAVPLVQRLRNRSWVTADRLTAFSTVASLISAVLFASQHWAIGAIVYQLSFLLDCLDGKIAAVRGKRHRWGGWFDAASDSVRIAACSVGLALGLLAAGLDARWQIALLVLYPCMRFATVMLVSARPKPVAAPPESATESRRATARSRDYMEVHGSAIAVLKVARRRRLRPGSTVDTEAIAFTVGPLTTFPFVGLLVATAMDSLHIAYMIVEAIRSARREATRSP